MKNLTLSLLAVSALPVLAGTTAPGVSEAVPSASADGFAQARRPISNPTLFDLALPTTNVHPIFLYHQLPDRVNTRLGSLPVGGDVELYALQFEIALNERLSIVATKDGYVDFNPDATLSPEGGFANLGAGVKYAFILDEVAQRALSGTMTFELPTGNSDVLQGEGKGAVNLITSGLQLVDAWQFAAGAGVQIPFSDEQSVFSFLSAHVSYELCSWFIPLVELNWYHNWNAGDGSGNFPAQVGGALPAVADFEGYDLFNIGSANGHRNRDNVTAAFGFRSRLTDCINTGVAYELPLTDDENGVTEGRLTVDLVWTF